MSDFEAFICPPPCECIDCQHSFYAVEEQYNPLFSYRSRVSSHDAQRIITAHVQDAQRDREYLQQRLDSHGDSILTRWKKKSRDKREALLVAAFPELCLHRWLIPRHTFELESQTVRGRTQARRLQLLLPWLSIDVLKMNPAVLFSLLHNRTAYSPQDWAQHDSRELILSWACGHFEVDYSDKCVIMHGLRYGELVDWKADRAHRGDIMGFPRAQLVLEAQSCLLKILRKIVDGILKGVDLSKPATSGQWRLITSIGFKHSGEVELWSSYANQAFSAPPIFNIDNLISIAQTRLNALGDHLLFLQTETTYMRRYIRVLLQGEFYKVAKGDEAAVLVTQELFTDVLAYWWWGWVKTECDHVKSVHDRFPDSIQPGNRLPLPYNRALGALELLLVNLVNYQTGYLGRVLPQRPGFSQNWSFERRPISGSGTQIELRRRARGKMKEVFEEDPLEWCLLQMQGDPDTQTNFDHAMLFAFLENHLAKSSSKERARVDEALYQKLSELAAYHEMLVSVRLHRPQNEARDLDEVVESENRGAWKRMKMQLFLPGYEKANLGKALLKDFYNTSSALPSGNRNSMWLQRSRDMRKALEAFWARLRELSKGMLEKSDFSAEEISAVLEIISANLTPEYISTVQAEEQQVLAVIENTRIPTTIPLQKEWGSSTTTEASASVSKTKSKTRPTEQPGITEGVQNRDDPTPDSTAEKATIRVTKRAFAVLTLLFPETIQEIGKKLDWDVFVHAMLDMGFTVKSGGGSAVLFENTNLVCGVGTDGGKIVFHKPHPVPNIDRVMLHIWGKRLERWFGWHRGLFVLES